MLSVLNCNSTRREIPQMWLNRFWLVAWLMLPHFSAAWATDVHRRLYVATPGIRNYLELGGHGLLVFDIDHDHRFLKRIPFGGLGANGQPLNVKGICSNAATARLYVSTLEQLICLDLLTERVLWQRSYEGGCDRMSLTPDGREIYLPTLEQDHWKIVDAAHGDEVARVVTNSGAHNTICGLSGRRAYLAGLRSPWLTVVDTQSRAVTGRVGPFGQSIRPFTLNRAETLVFVTINELLGFEIGDLRTGQKLQRVEVQGFHRGPVKRHGCPSHGIGLTPDEREIWVADGHNQCLHVFDATARPPRQLTSIHLRDQPGWITFSLDGLWAYPSTGEIIEVRSKQIVTALRDEQGREVHSEKMVELHFQDGRPVQQGDQFGLGRHTARE